VVTVFIGTVSTMSTMHDAIEIPGSALPSGAPRWAIEQIAALGPRPESFAAAQPLAVPARWSATGCNEYGVWGRCSGSSSEPYDTVVDHAHVAFACSCPSRITPCKHALALLLLWSRGQVGAAAVVPTAAQWLAKQLAAATSRAATQPAASPAAAAAPSAGAAAEPSAGAPGEAAATPSAESSSTRDDRVARMMVGLAELERWLDDRVRTGLADPSLARYATWDALAARLVDAQVGGLANRVRRLAGIVGAAPDWHEQLLAEIGLLHLLADAGRHIGTLPSALGDSVASAIGWQVRQADVLAGVAETDHWHVAGRSDVREDRIEVRRVWLRGRASGRWAMVLSFAAYGSRLDESLTVGSEVHADVFRYPGALGLRSIIGRRYDDDTATTTAAQPALPLPLHLAVPPVVVATVQAGCHEVGTALAAEPWIDRYPVTMRAAPTRRGGAWFLADHTGSVPISPVATDITTVLACSGGGAVTVTAEWTPRGFVPLALHMSDRTIDVGPVADPSFLAQAAG
jgi:hypothetical protein